MSTQKSINAAAGIAFLCLTLGSPYLWFIMQLRALDLSDKTKVTLGTVWMALIPLSMLVGAATSPGKNFK